MFPVLLILLSACVYALDVVTPYTGKVIFSPPSSYIVPRTLYARTVLIAQDGDDSNVLLATWENYSPEPPIVWFPIYRSTDLGQTWAPLSNVTDTERGYGLRYQPFLYELPEAIGNFPAGTILLSGSAIPTDLSSTHIEMYASLDKGRTWTFVSHVASGGVAVPNNGETPVWEPFLMVYNHQLVNYYSDQRDPAHGQKMVHQVTSDLLTWGPAVDDIAYSTYEERPGMPGVAHLPNGQYIFTYEYGNAPGGGFPIYYRLSSDPLAFDSAAGYILVASSGERPSSSPNVVWTPYGGTNGTIVVSANSHAGVFINKALAAPGSTWTYLATSATRSYTRELRVLPTNSQILITGGGTLGGSTNAVTATILQL